MIINHNCRIKLVPLVILIYDARSHIHQIRNCVCIYTQISLYTGTSDYPNIFRVHISQVDLSNIHVTVVGPGEAILRFESVYRHPAGVFVVPRTPRVCHLLVLVP